MENVYNLAMHQYRFHDVVRFPGSLASRMAAFVLPAILLASGCATTEPALRAGYKAEKPAWFEKTIIPQGEYIFAIGHSSPRETETLARDEALAEATREFARYCKADVSSLDRIYETYSGSDGKGTSSVAVENLSQVRVKAFVSHAAPDDWFLRREGGKYLASVILKVPKSEFERISSERNIKLSLDVSFYYEDASKKMLPLQEGSVLKSGDGYAIYVKPSDACYLYVYQVDSSGKSYRLFPNDEYKTASNPLPAALPLWIPNESDVMYLDENTGKESFYLFASPERIPELEGPGAASLNRRDIDSVASVKKMGAAGVRQKLNPSVVAPPAGAADAAQVRNKLQGEGAFTYETWFWHK